MMKPGRTSAVQRYRVKYNSVNSFCSVRLKVLTCLRLCTHLKMALDLKIELFAYDLFQQLFHAVGFRPDAAVVSVKYEEECNDDPDYEEVCHPVHFIAIRCREYLFSYVYCEKIDHILLKVMSSQMDYYECFLSICQDSNLFTGLTVFERVFATCTFLYQMSLACYYNNFEDCVDFTYLCWAMYFDKYSEEFYNQGGWQQLKRVAISYILPESLLYIYGGYVTPDSVFINKISLAVQNYSHFMKSTQFTSDTYAIKWARYRAQNYNRTDGPALDQIEVNTSSIEELEELLQNIRLCFGSALVYIPQPDELKQELRCKDNFGSPLNPAAKENNTSSTETICSDDTTDALIDAAGSILTLDSPHMQDVEETRSREQNATMEPESSPRTVEKLVGSLIDAPVCATDVESNQNAAHEDKGSFSLASHIDIVTKYRSVSADLDCNPESPTEISEVRVASYPRQSLNLGDVNTDPIIENIVATIPLEPCPRSIRKKMTSLEDEVRESKQQEDAKILAEVALDQKVDMSPGTERIKCSDRLDSPASCREIAKSFDIDHATPEESSRLQPKNSAKNRFYANDSILGECMTDEEDCETNCKRIANECTEVTMEDLSGDKVSESKAGMDRILPSASTPQDVALSNTKEAAKKKKKRKNAKSKKQNLQPEQESDDVVDLLRMFLVLGDQVGIRHVCSTLQSSEKSQSVFTPNIPK